MNDPSLSDEDIRRLLDAVATDSSINLPNKEALRNRIIDEFQTGFSAGRPQLAGQSDTDPALVELSVASLSEKPLVPWRRLCLSAAAVVLAATGIVTLTGRASNETIYAASNETQPIVTGPIDTTGLLNPGPYSYESVAGGIGFATSSAVIVTGLEPGLIVLQPAQGDSAASLSIMTATDSLEELLEIHRAAGVIELVSAAGTNLNGPVVEFEVRLQPGASEDGCIGTMGCLSIGRVTIETGSTVTVRELLGPGERRVWSLYQSDQYLDSFRLEANFIQESIEITSAS